MERVACVGEMGGVMERVVREVAMETVDAGCMMQDAGCRQQDAGNRQLLRQAFKWTTRTLFLSGE
jgi:hypothetical protein